MSTTRAVDVLARFAGDATHTRGRDYFSANVTRRIIAASTEAQLAVRRLQIVERDTAGDSRVMTPAPGMGLEGWAAVVFAVNASAIAGLDALIAKQPNVLFAPELESRIGFFSARTHLALVERSTEELRWQLDTVDASLGAAAAQGALPPDFKMDELQTIRDELVRRGAL